MMAPLPRRRLGASLGAGLAVFALGAALALSLLPEWRTGAVPDADFFRSRYRQAAQRAGLRLASGAPQVELTTPDRLIAETYKAYGGAGRRWLAAHRTAVGELVSHRLRSGPLFAVYFTLDGRPLRIDWEDRTASVFQPIDRKAFELRATALAAAMLAPGETLGKRHVEEATGPSSWARVELPGSSPPQVLSVAIIAPQLVSVERRPANRGLASHADLRMGTSFALILLYLALALAAAGIFLALLLRGEDRPGQRRPPRPGDPGERRPAPALRGSTQAHG